MKTIVVNDTSSLPVRKKPVTKHYFHVYSNHCNISFDLGTWTPWCWNLARQVREKKDLAEFSHWMLSMLKIVWMKKE